MKTATIRVQDQERPWPKGTTIFIGQVHDGEEWYAEAYLGTLHDGAEWYFTPDQTTGLFGQDDEVPDTFIVGETRVEGDDVIYTFEY